MKQITCLHCSDTYPDFDVAHVCSKGPYAPKLKPKINERIGKLAVEAGAQYCDLGDASCFKRLGLVEAVVFKPKDLEKFVESIVQQCIWAFGETRTEPSLEKYILDRLGINHGTTNSRT
jgi:hypothetical protein